MKIKKLKIGDTLYCKSCNLYFDILKINEDNNSITVNVIDPETSYEHEEYWDDLHNVYNALETGEYSLIQKKELKNNLKTNPFILTNTYPLEDYCFNEEIKGYGKYKNSGKPRKKYKNKKHGK